MLIEYSNLGFKFISITVYKYRRVVFLFSEYIFLLTVLQHKKAESCVFRIIHQYIEYLCEIAILAGIRNCEITKMSQSLRHGLSLKIATHNVRTLGPNHVGKVTDLGTTRGLKQIL